MDTKTLCVVLVGETGVGKSTLGPMLAGVLAMPFFDVDREMLDLLSVAAGPVDQIAARRQIIDNLLASGPAVIATGWEDVAAEIAGDKIRRAALTVWLQARPSGRKGITRPARMDRSETDRTEMVHTAPLRTAFALASVWQRAEVYGLADLAVDIDDLDIEPAAVLLVERVRAHLDKRPPDGLTGE